MSASWRRSAVSGETESGEDSGGHEVYAEYLEQLVVDQNARNGSVEQCGLSVVTTSAALVSLLFGLVAVITGVDDFTLPDSALITRTKRDTGGHDQP